MPTLIEVALVTCVLVYLYDVYFALITLAVLVAYIAWTISVTEWRTRYYRASVEANTAASASAVDSLLNYETVKYFDNEGARGASATTISLRQMEEANVMSYKTLAVLNVGQSAIIAIGVTAMMFKAAAGVVAGKLSVGDLVLVNAYLLQMAMPLNYLGMMYREVKQALTNIERLWGLLDEQQDVQDRSGRAAAGNHAAAGCVRARAVRLRPAPGNPAWHRLRDPARGTGRGGRAFGHRQVDAGAAAVPLLRRRRRRIDPHRRHATSATTPRIQCAPPIGIVPQDTVLFNDTIRYNIRYGRPSASRRGSRSRRAGRAHPRLHRVAARTATTLRSGERGLKLSGGEKQRVAIARALAEESGDPDLRRGDLGAGLRQPKKPIQAELDRIAVGRTTLVIAHRLSTVMDADQILVMDAGNIVERGSHARVDRAERPLRADVAPAAAEHGSPCAPGLASGRLQDISSTITVPHAVSTICATG